MRSDRDLWLSVAGIWVGFVLRTGGWLVFLDGVPFASCRQAVGGSDGVTTVPPSDQ